MIKRLLTGDERQVEQMKKQKAKKVGGKKDENSEPVVEATKAEEETADVDPEEKNGNGSKGPKESESKDVDEAAPAPERLSHGRQPSISVQSKMRSSSFRASGGPLSPPHGFPTDGDTAADIYRKQASRIEELEKENKRLAKEATDGQKRWKKAEEELEDLREADGDSAKGKDVVAKVSSQELEKLVSNACQVLTRLANTWVTEDGKCGPSATNCSTSVKNLEAWLFSLGFHNYARRY